MSRFAHPLPAFLAALLTLAAPGGQAAERIPEAAAACRQCHGLDGIARFPTVPHLAGQPAPYLTAQMNAFRRAAQGAGGVRGQERHATVMGPRAARLSDRDVQKLASHYAGLPCPLAGARTGDGRIPKLAARCVACHGPEGRTTSLVVPRLAGQQERYLENQLRALRDSDPAAKAVPTQRERHHRMMGRQAANLSDAEIRSLARYFATRRCR